MMAAIDVLLAVTEAPKQAFEFLEFLVTRPARSSTSQAFVTIPVNKARSRS